MQEISERFKPFRLSPLTRAIEELMESTDEGYVTTYQDLSKLIGLDCTPQGRGYSYVLSAIRRLEGRGCNFANIPSAGYRRLDPNETVIDNNRRFKNTRKAVKRTVRRSGSLDYARLGDMEKLEWRAATIVGRLASRILSGQAKTKMIEEIKKNPEDREIDFEGLTDIYMRAKS